MAARSIALMSEKLPLYSAMGVRAPLTITIVRQSEQNSRDDQIDDRDRRDAAIARMQRREHERCDCDSADATPHPNLLIQVSAEEQLFVHRGRSEDSDQLQPRKPSAAH